MSIAFFLTIFAVLLLALLGASIWALSKITEEYTFYFWRRILIALHVLAIIVFFSGYTIFDDKAFTPTLIRLATIVVVAELIFTVLIAIGFVITKCMGAFSSPVTFSRSRRNLLKGALLYPATAVVATVYGASEGIDETVEREYQIPIKNLPENLKGFRIAQISDVHLGRFFSLERFKELLTQVAAGKPDALLMTGDIFDDVRINNEAIKIVDGFSDQFPNGIWYCYGNHEHFRGIAAIEEALKNTKINLLNNSSKMAVDGKRPLYFLGVDYPPSREEKKFVEEERAFVNEALKGVPADSVKILLAHHPEFIDAAREKNIQLTLTGHTHGSQFGILGCPLFPVFKYTRGFYNKGDSFGYVHTGNGSWFPYRIGCPPEIVYFTLRKG